MPQTHQLLKSSLLLLGPVLITAWFVADGGLQNGLNRFGYEVVMGLFFIGHGIFWSAAEIINRWRKQACAFNIRLIGWSFALFLIWLVSAKLYENFF